MVFKPKEGIFKRDPNDKHYLFWNLRNIIKKWPLFISASNPFPWLKNRFILRFFGVKIGKSVVLYEGYIDPEFIEIGNDTMTSLHVCIFSHLIYHDKVIIKKVKIGKKCIIGPHTIISPGTIIKDGTILPEKV